MMNSSYAKAATISNNSINLGASNQYKNQINSPQLYRSPMIPRTPSRHTFFLEGIPKDSNKKSISFSPNSPKRYSLPESFKTPPSPNKFKYEHNCSSILRSKKINQNYDRQVILTPSSSYKTTFNEKTQGSISPLINRYNFCGASKNSVNQKNNGKSVDSCQTLILVITFLVASCIVTLTLIWI